MHEEEEGERIRSSGEGECGGEGEGDIACPPVDIEVNRPLALEGDRISAAETSFRSASLSVQKTADLDVVPGREEVNGRDGDGECDNEGEEEEEEGRDCS